jgi:hypothetical protein
MLTRMTLLLLSAMFIPGFAWAQTAELINQAKKQGGEVVLYMTMTVGDFQHFNKAAKEKYPFRNIRHVYMSSARQAGVLGNSPETLIYFNQQGVLSSYLSPEAKNLLKGAWDPDGYWSGITTDLLVTGFNLGWFRAPPHNARYLVAAASSL